MATTADFPLQRRRFDWRALVEFVGPLLALAALVTITAAADRSMHGSDAAFLKPENIVNILRQNAAIGIVAVGMTIVIVGGGIDLSVGALVAMAGGLGVWVMNAAIKADSYVADNAAAYKDYQDNVTQGLNLPLELPHPAAAVAVSKAFLFLHVAGNETCGVILCVLTTLLIATLAGWIAGLIIAKGRVAPFVVTLGLLAAWRAVALTVADGGTYIAASDTIFPKIREGGITVPHVALPGGGPLVLPWAVIVWLLTAIVAAVLLNRTRFGRYVYAVGSNERAAVYSAVNVDRVKIATYAIIGITCGIAAIIFATRTGTIDSSSTGQLYELDAIAAVVIGGTRLSGGSGTIRGTIVGTLILGVINNMLLILNVSSHPQGLIKGGIIIAAVLLQQVGRRR